MVHKGAEPLGISIVSGENGGIFVSKVTGGSIAHQAGLEYGDQLLEVGTIDSVPERFRLQQHERNLQVLQGKEQCRNRLTSEASDRACEFFKGSVPLLPDAHLLQAEARIH